MRDHIEIDMPQFEAYIKKMNAVVKNLVESNRIFTRTIQTLESEGWCDDVYRDAHNYLMEMQGETNVFINILYELDSELVMWYGGIFEEYADEDYTPPHIDMETVAVIPELVRRNDAHFRVSLSTVETYVNSTRKYVEQITAELDDFDTTHDDFAEYFQTAQYDRLTDELRIPLDNMRQILEEMDAYADYVDRKKPLIWKHLS